MQRLKVAALGILVLGIVILAYSAYLGEMSLYILVIIPVIQSASPVALAGMALVFVAIFLFFVSLAQPFGELTGRPSTSAAKGNAPSQPGKKFGGVVFIGPIPIVFGSDKKMAKWMFVVAIVIVILLVIVLWYFATQTVR